jgi:hypothetical protein
MILANAGGGIRFNEHMQGDGETVFRHACKLGLEGIVSKRKVRLSFRPLVRLAQDEERRCTGSEARSRGGLEQRDMATIDAAIKGFIVHDRESGGLFAYGQWTRCAPRDPGDAGLAQTRPRGESIIALSDIAANGDIEGTLGELQNILPSAIVAAALPLSLWRFSFGMETTRFPLSLGSGLAKSFLA